MYVLEMNIFLHIHLLLGFRVSGSQSSNYEEMEVTYFSQMADFEQITCNYVLEDRTVHHYYCLLISRIEVNKFFCVISK
jgi:hypothetical protein